MAVSAFGAANTPAGYLATVVDLAVVIAAVVSVVTGSVAALVVWESVSAAYLLAGCVLARHLTSRDLADSRAGALDVMSWAFPLAAGLAGANAALTALVGQSDGSQAAVAAVGMTGIVVSWLLLHLGFSNIYASVYDRDASRSTPGLVFPGESDLGLVEFVYFALTVGPRSPRPMSMSGHDRCGC